MGRSSVLRSLLVGALLVAGAAGCSWGVGTAPEDYVPDDGAPGASGGADGAAAVDLLVDGPQEAVAELRAAVGGPVRALQLTVYPDSVYLEAQRPGDPGRVDVYRWDAGEGASEGGEKDVAGVDLEAQLFALSQVDLSALPGLVADAPGLTGVRGDVTSSVTVQRPAGSPTLVTVFVSTPRGQNGAVVADAAGNVLSTT